MLKTLTTRVGTVAAALALPLATLLASSHREAPLIADDPLADNTDVYAFRSPDDPSTVTLIANYIPMQLPQGGPNYYHFSDRVRYEIHVDNDATNPGDEVTYRFSFTRINEDPTTFFNVRLGAENINTSYDLEKSLDGGRTWTTIVENGETPAYNIGPRSIESAAGLGASSYAQLMQEAITTASSGETVFAGPVEDPFFVDFNVFDLGDSPRQSGDPRDGLVCFNVHTLALKIPIENLLKAGAPAEPTDILDPDYVIGVWASASRPAIRTLGAGTADYSGDWRQVSRLGMPLTNEVVVSVGQKDYWNAITPYDELTDTLFDGAFYNPELALYMDDDQFGGAVPAFAPLRVQTASLGSFDFTNGADGLYALKGTDAVAGTALAEDAFGALLLPAPGKPRSVDLWPAFHTGVPNLAPYQLATGKEGGNPLAAGKPFVNNFLPNGGDMLRLNMAVPPTPRDSEDFSSMGLVNAAVLGLTDPRFNASADLQAIPNMDGFPNGRRLEDDVTRIELQAVSGVVLAAIGLFYDDYDPESGESPVTQDLLDVLTYTTGVEENDLPFEAAFPYEAAPRSGAGPCSGEPKDFTSGFADLELSIKLKNTNFTQFQQIPYVISVTNTGDQPATDVVVSAGLPAGLVFTSAEVSQGEYSLFFERFTVGTLAPGQTATLELTLFSLVADGPITNFVQVISAGTPDFDSDPGNAIGRTVTEDDESSITINPGRGGGGLADGSADISVDVTTPSDSFYIYNNVPYTVTVTNDGPDAANNVVVQAGLPDGLVFTSSELSKGDYNLFFEEWTVGTLASGETQTLTLTLFTLTNDAPVTQFVQLFAVDEGDPDSGPANANGQTVTEDDEALSTIYPITRCQYCPGNENPTGRRMALVQGEDNAGLDFAVYPTVLQRGQELTVELNGVNSDDVELRILDANGSVIQNQSAGLSLGSTREKIGLPTVAAGFYIVQVVADGQPINAQRFVVR